MPDTSVRDIVTKLENGVKDLFESDKYREYLKTMSRFPRYSTRNTLLIHMQMPAATKVGGFGFWRDKMNRRVNKGEHAIKIIAPIATGVPDEPARRGGSKGKDIEVEKIDPVTKLPILDEHGLPVMERLSPTSNLQVRFKMVSVFDESQTEGEPLPELAETLTGDVERYELFMDALRAVSPLPIEFAPLDVSMDGRCIFGDKIEIREGMSQAQTVSAAIHEIAHSVMHDRAKEIDRGEEPKSRRVLETEAESVSYVVSQHFGIETGANSFGYIAEYAKNRELKELTASLDVIRKTSASLIDAIGEKYRALAQERGIDITAKAEKTADAPELPDINESLREEAQNAVEYTPFQKKGFAIADSYANLPLQDRLNIIAETFGCKTASIETSPCTGKWRGTSDISIRFDNGASLFIDNRQTPEAKKQSTISACVNNALAQYNPQTVAEAKRNAYIALLEQERKDNAAAESRGLKPYKVLAVEMNDGHDKQTGGYLGWYYVTLEVGGKIFGHLTSNLNYDISRGAVGEDYGKRDYFVAGGLRDIDVDYVFANVGHSTADGAYKMELTQEVLQRAQEASVRREQFQSALGGMESVEHAKPTLENRLYDKLEELFPDFMSGKYSYLKLESPGMEPLSLEWQATQLWSGIIAGDRIRVLHTYELNGDLCYDPMIEFVVNGEERTLTPSSFELSLPPLYQYHDEDGIGRSVDGNGNAREVKNLRGEIGDFAESWFQNIGEQGFVPVCGMLARGEDDEIRVEFDKDGNPIIPDELPYDEAAWHDLADIEDDDLRAAKKAEIDELLSGGKKETEKLKGIDLSLPDPAWTAAELAEYGYTEPDMYPLSVGRAVELFDAGHTIYLLYPDNTEAVAFDRDEIIAFSSDGFCGITKTDWELSPIRDAQNKVYENVILNREQIENSRESELIHSGKSMFGIYQIRDDIAEARNFRFAPMRELEALGLKVDRDNYTLVYTGELPIRDTQTNLHRIYQEFQHDSPECPADFTFPSVSVGDVIVLQWRGEVSSHFVDSAGFKELPSFTGNEREQPALYQIDTTSPGIADPEADVMAGKSISGSEFAKAGGNEPQKPISKGKYSLLDDLAETKKQVAHRSQTAVKQSEREV